MLAQTFVLSLAALAGVASAVPVQGGLKVRDGPHGHHGPHHTAPATTTTAATSTTSAASSATTTASSSGSIQSGGVATYFLQGGNAGACGTVHSDSDLIVAIPYAWWGSSDSSASSYCGKKLSISAASTGETITATVADLCPTCDGNNSLDLSVGAISALAGSTDYTQEGEYAITWQWL